MVPDLNAAPARADTVRTVRTERTAPAASRRGLLGLAGAACAALLMPSCTRRAAPRTWPEISFAPARPLVLDVSEIVFVDAVSPPAATPPARDMTAALPVSTVATMRRWAGERLAAAGSGGQARVSLIENRFVAWPLDTGSGIEALFTDSQSARFEGRLALRVDILGDPAGSGFAEARASASRTVPESASLEQRREVWWELAARLARELDRALREEMRSGLARWLAIGGA